MLLSPPTTEHTQARIGSRSRSEEYTETWVDDHASEQVERRPNDTNANGDCPIRETSGDRGRQTQNSEGTRTTDRHMNNESKPPRGGALAGGKEPT